MGSTIRWLLFLLAPVILHADEAPLVSLHPLYTPATAVRNPALVDLWSDAVKDSLFSITFRIEPDGEDGYNVILGGETRLRFHLVELGGEIIADVVFVPDSDWAPPLPAHFIAHLRVEGGTLRVDWLGFEKLVQRIVETGSPRYERLSDEGEDLLVLTASTAELRQFVLDCLKRPDAFAESSTFERAGPKPRAADLNERSWEVVRGRASPEAYASALQRAEEAVRLVSDDADYWTTLGAALYRTARYSEALAALTSAEQLAKSAKPYILAYRAMAHKKLGEWPEAEAVLGELRKMLGDSRFCGDQESLNLLHDVENVISPREEGSR